MNPNDDTTNNPAPAADETVVTPEPTVGGETQVETPEVPTETPSPEATPDTGSGDQGGDAGSDQGGQAPV